MIKVISDFPRMKFETTATTLDTAIYRMLLGSWRKLYGADQTVPALVLERWDRDPEGRDRHLIVTGDTSFRDIERLLFELEGDGATGVYARAHTIRRANSPVAG